MENLVASEEYDLDIKTDSGNYQGKVDHLVISITNKLGSLVFTKENQICLMESQFICPER